MVLKKELLVVNKSPVITAFLKSYLSSKEVNITVSHTNTQVLLALSSNVYSTVITDIALAGTSGLELINTIKNNCKKSKVLVLCHMDQKVQKEMISQLGALTFLKFPIDLKYLNSIIV